MKIAAYILGVVIIVILLYFGMYWHSSDYDDVMTGFWTADDTPFCRNAGIKSMMLYIGEKDKGQRECYIVVMDNMTKQGLTMKNIRGMAPIGVMRRCHFSAKVEFDEEQIWDENIKIMIDIVDGSITITDTEGTVCAELTKQHELTNIAEYMK